jgi:4-diphosphocytidyl-2-C-methyl-D-erythritol kinase
MPPATATVLAPAKLTLSLRITGVRDDGFHLIDAEMVSLDLADELEIEPEASGDAATALEIIDGLTGRISDIPVGEDNLVIRALRLAGREAQVRLTKRIPPGGGLGGGSADAAAILRWAGFTDLEAAARLGADVPFCLVGGRGRVQGIGEIIDPLPFVARDITVVTPPFGCSTPAVYAAWDRLGGPRAEGPNDLEAAALEVEPRLAAVRDELGNATGATPVLAGSGSTWFVEGAFPGEGRIVTRTIPATGYGEGGSAQS